MFDVDTNRDAKVDLLLLTEKLSKVSQGVKIHDHSNWYAPILKISNGLFCFAFLLSSLIFATVCATVIFITKKTLNAHEDIVKILQLIGANNAYIASQFKKYYFAIGCKASILSLMLGAATILGITFIVPSEADSRLLTYVAILITMPLITTALLIVTTKKSVIFFLNNDEWIG
jgi:cell division transport system permease protein